MSFHRQLGVGKPALVVVPLSTLPNWAAELSTWAPQVGCMHGKVLSTDT